MNRTRELPNVHQQPADQGGCGLQGGAPSYGHGFKAAKARMSALHQYVVSDIALKAGSQQKIGSGVIHFKRICQPNIP